MCHLGCLCVPDPRLQWSQLFTGLPNGMIDCLLDLGKGHGIRQELEDWNNMLVMTTLLHCIVPFKVLLYPQKTMSGPT